MTPPNGKGATFQPTALLPHGADIALTTQVLFRAEAHGGKKPSDRRAGGLGPRRAKALGRALARSFRPAALAPMPSDDGQTLAALETTGADDFAAAFGGHARAITNLAGALLAVRAECGLHDFVGKRGSEVSEGAPGVKGGFLTTGTLFGTTCCG